MDHPQNDSSEQQQGFFKPQLKVIQSNQSPLPSPPKNEQLSNQANDLIIQNRPTDYLPRVLTIAPKIITQTIDLDINVVHERQIMAAIGREKKKRLKYFSLKEKYNNNSGFQLVYSKIEANTEFNSYIFPLNQTTDYNPNDYQPPQNPILENPPKFQSHFESGNLLYAYKSLQSSIQQYDLILQNDTNTKGYNQWFYFSFRNENSTKVRFNIVNFVKKHSLFQDGVKPVGFSLQKSSKGWFSIGNNIQYSKSYVLREVSSNPPIMKNYYTLSFTVDFQTQNDLFYIALNYPYTYTRMIGLINQICDQNLQMYTLPLQSIRQRSIVAYSISNNALPLLRLSNPQNKQQNQKKILIMGRQHPGQTVGSFVFEGFIKSLIKDRKLLQQYEIIAIPMINPDGVIYGNFRTNLSGFDLNRQWVQPNKWMHPQIYYIKRYLESIQNIQFVIDFHGHSKKYNSFIYACIGQPQYLYRIFPYICSQQTELFSIKDSTFSVTMDKEKTARVKLFRQIQKPNIFTLQTSFFGYIDKNQKKIRYQIKDLFQIGSKIMDSLKIFLLKKKQTSLIQNQVKQKEYLFDQWSLQNKQDMDSQSNPSQDQLTPFQRKQKVILDKPIKKRKGRSKKKKKQMQSQRKVNLTVIQKKQRNIFQDKRDSTSEQVIIYPSKPSKIPTNYKPKRQNMKLVNFNQIKITKKIQKSLSIIEPPMPKLSTPNIIPVGLSNNPSTFIANLTAQIKGKEKMKEIQNGKMETLQGKNKEEAQKKTSKIQINPSNLLNTTNYYTQIQDKIKSKQKQMHPHQKTQSLQINNIRKDNISSSKGSNLNLLKKLIPNDIQQLQKNIPIESFGQKMKNKQRNHLIRQNRIVSSVARIQQQQMKRNLQQQINSRTQALRNCQKKMRQISFDNLILMRQKQEIIGQSNNLERIANFTPKSYIFPTIRMDRKLDYFHF